MENIILPSGKTVLVCEPYRPAEAMLATFVGRDRELKMIAAAWLGGGRFPPLSPLLVGEPGVGKNRLVYELSRQTALPLHILQGHEDVTAEDWSYAHGAALFVNSGGVSIANSLFAGGTLSAQRRQDLRGSAVYLREGSLDIVNSTFAENRAAPAIHNRSANLVINSSIISFNNDHITQITDPAVVTYSAVQGGYDGPGNIDYNPVFDLEYRILPSPPAIDAGDPIPGFQRPPLPAFSRHDAQ